MTNEERNNLPIGVKVRARIEGRPPSEKFHLFHSQGMQTDDIGGYYEEVPAIPDVWVDAVIIESPDSKGKIRKFVQWTNHKGNLTKRLLFKFKNKDIIIREN